jgi:hypothetical protein
MAGVDSGDWVDSPAALVAVTANSYQEPSLFTVNGTASVPGSTFRVATGVPPNGPAAESAWYSCTV